MYKITQTAHQRKLDSAYENCKYEGEINYKEIKELWLNADEAKSEKKRIESRLR